MKIENTRITLSRDFLLFMEGIIYSIIENDFSDSIDRVYDKSSNRITYFASCEEITYKIVELRLLRNSPHTCEIDISISWETFSVLPRLVTYLDSLHDEFGI